MTKLQGNIDAIETSTDLDQMSMAQPYGEGSNRMKPATQINRVLLQRCRDRLAEMKKVLERRDGIAVPAND